MALPALGSTAQPTHQEMLTKLCLKLGVLFPSRAQVLLCKLQRLRCLALPDQLYHALLLQVEVQLMALLQNLDCTVCALLTDGEWGVSAFSEGFAQVCAPGTIITAEHRRRRSGPSHRQGNCISAGMECVLCIEVHDSKH